MNALCYFFYPGGSINTACLRTSQIGPFRVTSSPNRQLLDAARSMGTFYLFHAEIRRALKGRVNLRSTATRYYD